MAVSHDLVAGVVGHDQRARPLQGYGPAHVQSGGEVLVVDLKCAVVRDRPSPEFVVVRIQLKCPDNGHAVECAGVETAIILDGSRTARAQRAPGNRHTAGRATLQHYGGASGGVDNAAGVGDRSPGQLQRASVRGLQHPGIGEGSARVVGDDQCRRLVGADRRLVAEAVAGADCADPARSVNRVLVRQGRARTRLTVSHDFVAGVVGHDQCPRPLEGDGSAHIEGGGEVVVVDLKGAIIRNRPSPEFVVIGIQLE